jgi:hypothetical protein
MPDDDSGSEISESREQSASHKWRAKLLSKTGKLGKAVDKAIREKNVLAQQESDVSNFLHGPGDKPFANPHVDTTSASRWPAAAVVLGTVERPGSSSSRPSTATSSRPATAKSSYLPALPPRRKRVPKGLHVSFSTATPEIIGEGGDESELPPKDVVRAWSQPGNSLRQQPVRSAIYRTEAGREAALPAALVPAYDRRSQRSPPPRTTTTVQRKPVASLDDQIHMEAGGDAPLLTRQESQSMPGQSEIRQGHSISRPYPESEPSPMPKPDSVGSFPGQPLDIRSRIIDSKVVEQVSQPKSYVPPASERPLAVERQSSHQSTHTAPSASLPVANDASNHQPETPITPTYGYKDVVSPYLDEFLHDGSARGSSKVDDNGDEFYSRVEHLHGVFHLASQRALATADESVAVWIRASSWWFLKGRNKLENKVRTAAEQLPGFPATPQSHPQALQCYVDLAKAWWIAREILPDQLQRAQQPNSEIVDGIDGLGLHLVQQAYASLQANMNALTISMQKNRLLPPSSLLIQGLDSTIWLDYPVLSPDILAVTADTDPRTATKRTSPNADPLFAILLGDTDRHFSYGQVFVEVEIISEYEGLDEYQLPCVLSIIRERVDSRVEVIIVSQNGCINLHIQSDKNRGPTWDDVEWKVRSHSIRIHLAKGFELAVRFWDADFKTLWGIHDYNRRVEKEWCAGEDESVVFSDLVDTFHYIPPADSRHTFPSKPVRSCKIRLFESSHVPSGSSFQRNKHSGHRLMAMTPPDSKSLSSISTAFGPANPVLFSYLRGEGGRPALLLSIRERNTKSTMVLTFQDMEKRAELHALLNGTYLRNNDCESAKFPLEGFSISVLANGAASTARDLAFVPETKWEHVRLIEEEHRSTFHTEAPQLSDRRIVIKCNLGTVTDRIGSGISLNLAPPAPHVYKTSHSCRTRRNPNRPIRHRGHLSKTPPLRPSRPNHLLC